MKGSFDEAWRQHCAAGKSPIDASLKLGLAAWAAYEAIIQKQLLPEDESR